MVGKNQLKQKLLTPEFLIEQLSAVEKRLKTHLENRLDERLGKTSEGLKNYFENRLDERLDIQMESFKAHIDSRFAYVGERFNQIDQRFEQVDKRFERVDKQISFLRADFKTMTVVVKQTYDRVESIETDMKTVKAGIEMVRDHERRIAALEASK